MNDRVVEILMFLMSEIQENKTLQDIDIGELRSRGYTQAEIGAAFVWLHDHFQSGEGVLMHAAKASRGSRRVFHDAEKHVISIESQGYLIQLRELGVLDDRDLENVVERALLTGYQKLSHDEVKDLVTAVLFGRENSGKRPMLNNDDLIH